MENRIKKQDAPGCCDRPGALSEIFGELKEAKAVRRLLRHYASDYKYIIFCYI